MKLSELYTNEDGRLSTTTSIQLFGAILMAGILVYSVWLNRPYTPELFSTFALFCAGSVATKGAVSMYSRRQNIQNQREQGD
ncbi:hypothetical protein CEP49_06695 [Mergibacter septicus]|uniref:DUF2644 domain-containing protein n=1 Tax=Mergibacter septicus TaxID=221402 RepID=UPI0011791788|nr:DUF2644 domain-containing protein [Mergibacter septicus]AWX14259.1 hypothetical protein CEP49_06695 [Mergibacter septicus]